MYAYRAEKTVFCFIILNFLFNLYFFSGSGFFGLPLVVAALTDEDTQSPNCCTSCYVRGKNWRKRWWVMGKNETVQGFILGSFYHKHNTLITWVDNFENHTWN